MEDERGWERCQKGATDGQGGTTTTKTDNNDDNNNEKNIAGMGFFKLR